MRKGSGVCHDCWKMALHTQLPRSSREEGPKSDAHEANQVLRNRFSRALKMYGPKISHTRSLKSVHGCLLVPPGVGIQGHLRTPGQWDPRKEQQPFPGKGFAQEEGRVLELRTFPQSPLGVAIVPQRRKMSAYGVSFPSRALYRQDPDPGLPKEAQQVPTSVAYARCSSCSGRRLRPAGRGAENKAAAGVLRR